MDFIARKIDGEIYVSLDQVNKAIEEKNAEIVDEAIAELKAHIDDLEKLNHDLCERVTENDEIRLHWEEIEQTRAENESLKAKLENVQASAYADSVDAGMRERRLRRALYRVLALWANERARLTWSWRKEQGWLKMERKCRAMAEKWR